KDVIIVIRVSIWVVLLDEIDHIGPQFVRLRIQSHQLFSIEVYLCFIALVNTGREVINDFFFFLRQYLLLFQDLLVGIVICTFLKLFGFERIEKQGRGIVLIISKYQNSDQKN